MNVYHIGIEADVADSIVMVGVNCNGNAIDIAEWALWEYRAGPITPDQAIGNGISYLIERLGSTDISITIRHCTA